MIPWAAPTASGPIEATVSVPGSKSASARALLLAAIAAGPGEIHGLLDARDTRLMRAALEALGAQIVDVGPGSVDVVPASTLRPGAVIDCGLSGTVMRFVPALAALAEGTTRFHGDPGASERPVAPLLAALRHLGAGVDADALPFEVSGPAGRGGAVTVDASGSSQFLSALLLAGCLFPEGLRVTHAGAALPSLPHVRMTVEMLTERGVSVTSEAPLTWAVAPGRPRGAIERIEPDLTNAATVCAAALITGGTATTYWPQRSLQAGDELLRVLAAFGADVRRSGDNVAVSGTLRGADVDLSAVSELACTAAALAALAPEASRISGVAHIRGHETDRLAALTREINGLGGRVTETADGLTIEPAALHGGSFHTYADHRMAHTGALIGLAVPGVVLDDIGCTTKTLPTFPALWAELVGR